jgi:hypothetical protein
MVFTSIVFLTAFLMESIGTVVSVIGLTNFLGFNLITICLAVVFDIAKLVTVSLLYKNWKTMPSLLKIYMIPASIVLIAFTSFGAAGYLTSEFQKALMPTATIDLKVASLEQEKTKLESRKIQIDNQISNLPTNSIKGRTKLIETFKEETNSINKRLVQLDQELPDIKMESVSMSSHSNAITSLSKILNISVERTMGFIIGIIVFVFDPLAIALIVSGNFLLEKNSKEFITLDTSQQLVEKDKSVVLFDSDNTGNEEMSNAYNGLLDNDDDYLTDALENIADSKTFNPTENEPIFIPDIVEPEPEIEFDERRKSKIPKSSLTDIDDKNEMIFTSSSDSDFSNRYYRS